jgi:hypothetical protein
VSFPSVPASFPAAGTILETLTAQTYPIAEGGASVEIANVAYASQTASVYKKANGTGGDYLDWASAFNIQYIPNETNIVSITTNHFVNVLGVDYDSGSSTEQFKHNGTGGYGSSVTYSYVNSGTFIVAGTSPYNVDMSTNCSGTVSGTVGTITINYYHDGYGGSYATAPTTGYFSYRTLSTSENCFYDDGMGGGYWQNTYYYSDGNGGYFADSTYP